MSQYHDFLSLRTKLQRTDRNASEPIQSTDQNYYNIIGSQQLQPYQEGSNLPTNNPAANMPIFPELEESVAPDSRNSAQPKNVNADLYAQALAVKSSLGLLDSSNSSALDALRSYGPSSNISHNSPVHQTKSFLSHSQALDAFLYDSNAQRKSDGPSSFREYCNQGDSDSNASSYTGVKPILDLNLKSVDDEDEFLYGESNPSEQESLQKGLAQSSPQIQSSQKDAELIDWNDDERGVKTGGPVYPASGLQFANALKGEKKSINITLKKTESSINTANKLLHPSSTPTKDGPIVEKKDPSPLNKSSGENSGKYGNAANFLRQQLNLNKSSESGPPPTLPQTKTRLAELSASSLKHMSDNHGRMISQNLSLDKQDLKQMTIEMGKEELGYSNYGIKNPDKLSPQIVNLFGESRPSHDNEIQHSFLKTKSNVDVTKCVVPPKNYRSKEVDEYVDEHPAERLRRAFNQVIHSVEKDLDMEETSHNFDISSKNRPSIPVSDTFKQRPHDTQSSRSRRLDYIRDHDPKYRSRENPRYKSPDRGLDRSRSRRDRSRSPIRRSGRDRSRSPERLYRPKNQYQSPLHRESNEKSYKQSRDKSPNRYHHSERRDRNSSERSSSVESLKGKKPAEDFSVDNDIIPERTQSVKTKSESILTPALAPSDGLPKPAGNVKASNAYNASNLDKKSQYTDAECSKIQLVNHNKIIFSLSSSDESGQKNKFSHEASGAEVNELSRRKPYEYQVADNLRYLIQLGLKNQLLDNFRKFSKLDLLESNTTKKDKKSTPTSKTEMLPSSSNASTFFQQATSTQQLSTFPQNCSSAQQLSLPPTLPRLPESNLNQQPQAIISNFSESLQPVSMYTQDPQSVYPQQPQPIYLQSSLYPHSQPYGHMYPQVPNPVLAVPETSHLQSSGAMQQNSLVQPAMYPSYPYPVPPNTSYPSSAPYNPLFSSAVTPPMQTSAVSPPMQPYPYIDVTQLPPSTDFSTFAKKEKKPEPRVCTLKSVPILSDDQPVLEPNFQETNASSTPQKTPWVEVTKNPSAKQSQSTFSKSSSEFPSSTVDEKKVLVAKYSKLLEERDIIKKHMQEASKYTIKLKKRKEDLEKKTKGYKKGQLSDFEALNLVRDQYEKATEALKNYIDEAKQINYKVKEMQPIIESESLKKTEKKIEERPSNQEPPPTHAPVIYSCYDTGNHWCEPCTKSFSTLGKLMEHLHSDEHLKHMDPFKVLTDSETVKETKSNSNSTLHPVQGVEFMKPVYAYYCSLCKMTLRNRGFAELHLKGHDHTMNYMNYTKENPYYVKKRELLKTARIAAAIKKKREAELEKKEKLLKEKMDIENKIKAKLKEEKSLEKKIKELDESNITDLESQKNNEIAGIKVTLASEKENSNKDQKTLSKQNVIYIGRAPNFKGRTKVNLKKIPEPKKPKVDVVKDTVIEKIIEEINDPYSNRKLSKIPIEETEVIGAPVPSKESKKSSVVESSNDLKDKKSTSIVPTCQNKVEVKSDVALKSSKKRGRDDDDPSLQNDKLTQSGCQTEIEAKLSKEDKEPNFPDRKSSSKTDDDKKKPRWEKDDDKKRPSGKRDEDKKKPRWEKDEDEKRPSGKKDDDKKKPSWKRNDDKKSNDPYKPKTDNPVVDQALQNILYGSKTSENSNLSGIDFTSTPSTSSSPPPKKKKTDNSVMPKKKPENIAPLTEEEQDFLLLGIDKSDLQPIAVPKPPPSALIKILPDIARKLPPFPPPLSIPPPSLILQSPTKLLVGAASNASYAVQQPVAQPSTVAQSQTPVSHSNSAVVDMEIDDDEPELPTSIIIHNPIPGESNAVCSVTDPKQLSSDVSSAQISPKSANSLNMTENVQIVSASNDSISETPDLTSSSHLQAEDAKTSCEGVVNLIVSDVAKQLDENISNSESILTNSAKEIELSAIESHNANSFKNTNLDATLNSSSSLEGESVANSCLAEPVKESPCLLTDCGNDLKNQTPLQVEEMREPCLKPASCSENIENEFKDCEQNAKLPDKNLKGDDHVQEVVSVGGNESNQIEITSVCDDTQSRNKTSMESSDLNQETLASESSEKNGAVSILKTDTILPHIENICEESSMSLDAMGGANVPIDNKVMTASEVVKSTESPIEEDMQETADVESEKINIGAGVNVVEDLPIRALLLEEHNVLDTGSESNLSGSSFHRSSDLDPKEEIMLPNSVLEARFEVSDEMNQLSNVSNITMSPKGDCSLPDMSFEANESVSRNILEQPEDSICSTMDKASETQNPNTSDADITLPAEKNSGQCTDAMKDKLDYNVWKPVVKIEPTESEEMDVPPMDSSQPGAVPNPCQPVVKSEPVEREKQDLSEKCSICQQPVECSAPHAEKCSVTIKVEQDEIPPHRNVYDAEGRCLADLELSIKIALASMLFPHKNDESSRPLNIAEVLSRNRWDLLVASNRHLEIERAVRERTSQLLRSSRIYTQCPSMKLVRTRPSYRQEPMERFGEPMDTDRSSNCSPDGRDTSRCTRESCSASERASYVSGNSEGNRRSERQARAENRNNNEDSPRTRNENPYGNVLLERNHSATQLDRFDSTDDMSFLQSHQAPHLGLLPVPRIFVDRIEQALLALSERRETNPGSSRISNNRRLLADLINQQLTAAAQELRNQGGGENSAGPSQPVVKEEKDESSEETSASILKKTQEEGTSVDKEAKVKKEHFSSEANDQGPSQPVEDQENKAPNSSLKIDQTKDQGEEQSETRLSSDENTESFTPSVSDDVELVYTVPSRLNEIPVIDIADSDEENAESDQLTVESKECSKRKNSERSKGKNDSDTDEYDAN